MFRKACNSNNSLALKRARLKNDQENTDSDIEDVVDSDELQWYEVEWIKSGSRSKTPEEGFLSYQHGSRQYTLFDPKLIKVPLAVSKTNSPTSSLHEKSCFTLGNIRIHVLLRLDHAPSISPIPKAFPTPSLNKKPKSSQVSASITLPHSVEIDSHLRRVLQPHQTEGISFLYHCIKGINGYYGALLADQMGLGKTLTAIGLVWTLFQLRNGTQPLMKRVLIVTPLSLVETWKKEILTFLGRERIDPQILSCSQAAKTQESTVDKFILNSKQQVLIANYEVVVKPFITARLKEGGIDMIILDEGHRLKNMNTISFKTLNSFSTKRRVVLTGTPYQNNLQELYALINFVNPGILGSLSSFNAIYGNPIATFSKKTSSEELVRLKELCESLNDLISLFTLKRDFSVLRKSLPLKREWVVFLPASLKQRYFYNGVINGKYSDPDMTVLAKMTLLRKICVNPNNIEVDHLDSKLHCDILNDATSPKIDYTINFINSCIDRKEKVVIVSCFTTTLDDIAVILDLQNIKHVRIDGSINVKDRTEAIHTFFTSPDVSVFLLSTKAGGVGLTLTSACNLVLVDQDWNPSNDLQAVARIYRYGQKCPVNIVRLVVAGTVEEMIVQRHLEKVNMSNSIINLESDEALVAKEIMKFSNTLGQTNSKDLVLRHPNLRLVSDLNDTVLKDSPGIVMEALE
ncbi:hypothetical protein RCL1_008435 [Eukaryota sp. TZLM3-RCL]